MCHWPCLAWIQAWDGSLGVQVRLFSWLFSWLAGRTAPFSAGTSVNRTRLCLSATLPLLLEAFNREPPVWTINKGGVLTRHLKTLKFLCSTPHRFLVGTDQGCIYSVSGKSRSLPMFLRSLAMASTLTGLVLIVFLVCTVAATMGEQLVDDEISLYYLLKVRSSTPTKPADSQALSFRWFLVL